MKSMMPERTGPAAIRIARDLVAEGRTKTQQAVQIVEPDGMSQVLAPAFRPADLEAAGDRKIAVGLPASPGAASGRIALTAERAVTMARESAEVSPVESPTQTAIITNSKGTIRPFAISCSSSSTSEFLRISSCTMPE